jgi:hypothetical protein
VGILFHCSTKKGSPNIAVQFIEMCDTSDDFVIQKWPFEKCVKIINLSNEDEDVELYCNAVKLRSHND